MKIAADFSQRVVVHSESLEWMASPMPGVDRRPLDRVGDEVARATTIVRYAPGSEFSPHVHSGGEEFMVLEGVFQDEHGDYPVGSYIRNPPQSKHKPGSQQGCTIFVKLWQFQPDDRQPVCLHTQQMQGTADAKFNNLAVIPLYQDTVETVSIIEFAANESLSISVEGGAELLVLDGILYEQDDTLTQHSWLRVPVNSEINAIAGETGARVWIKTGHLSDVENQIKRLNSQ